MTETLDAPISATPARRRALPAAPVLIRVPAVDAGPTASSDSMPRARRRRRLRREFRVAGCLILAILPTSLALARLVGDRRPAPAPTVADAPDLSSSAEGNATISISLEPILSAQPARDFAEAPVFLSGQLLPAEAPEESSHHGGH